MATLMIVGGISMMFVGLIMKPKGETIQHSWFWGFWAASTPMGKVVAILGAVLIGQGAEKTLEDYIDNQPPSFGYQTAVVEEWERAPVLRAKITDENGQEKSVRIYISSLKSKKAKTFATRTWPKGTEIWLNPGSRAKRSLQYRGKSPVLVGSAKTKKDKKSIGTVLISMR